MKLRMPRLNVSLVDVVLAVVGAAAFVFLVSRLGGQTPPDQAFAVVAEQPSRTTRWVVDDPEPSEVRDGQLRLRAYEYRPGAWRLLVSHTGDAGPQAGTPPIILTRLELGLPPGWTPRWPDQMGLELVARDAASGAQTWRLNRPSRHPTISAPAGAQVLTAGLTIFVELLEPGSAYTAPLPSPEAVAAAMRLLMIQPGKDSYWPALQATRALYTAPGNAMPAAPPVRTLGEYVLGGWSVMYPRAATQLDGPVYWLLPRWASHDVNNWHYAIPALALEEYLRRGDVSAYNLGLEMARRLATVGLCRSDGGPYRGGFWAEKGAWPGAFWQPVPEKAWDLGWIVAALLTPDDPLWADTYRLRRERLLGLDPTIVWPERYGARRPARVLHNLAALEDLVGGSPDAELRAQAKALIDHVWSRVPVGQHFLQGDSPLGTGSNPPLSGVPSSKLFMQLQWAPAAALWASRGVGTEHVDRLKALVRWQVDTWPLYGAGGTGRPRWPYMVAEADPTQRYMIYEVSVATWAQPVLTLAAAWFGGIYEDRWRANAEWVLPRMGLDPARGFDDRSGGPGRLKTISARLLALRDPLLPRR